MTQRTQWMLTINNPTKSWFDYIPQNDINYITG